jgi:hypothetical protein
VVLVPVLVAAEAAAAAVGGRLQQVVGVLLHGLGAQVLGQGHHHQRGDGAAMQQLGVVRGVQEAVAVAGGQAVRPETRQAGVARIRRHRVAGTCDGYCLLDQRLTIYSKQIYCLSKAL